MNAKGAPRPLRVVGIGASAGGLEALERFFERVEPAAELAWIVVQHLSPDHKSFMADILRKRTRLEVAQAQNGEPIFGGRIYLVPPRSNIEVTGGGIRLVERASGHALNLPIDVLFRSLAAEYGDRAVGIILSGTGSDGRFGVEAIKRAGGLVLVQDPRSAAFDGMPQAAVSTGMVDAVLPAEQLAGELLREVALEGEGAFAQEAADDLTKVHELLHKASGVDFSEYKATSVLRRLDRRMAALGSPSVRAYLERLQEEPAELRRLVDELLINVTHFFRDPVAWQALTDRVIPVLARGGTGEPVRVWVPACATGQEAYTIAMLLLEHLPPERDFKVFATDVDTTALEIAAAGVYSAGDVEGVGRGRLARFFAPHGESWVIDANVRRRVVFAAHNLAKDPPFTRLDLVTCRNVLIYLTPPLQRRVLEALSFALKTDGFLLLGPSETLGECAERFRPVDSHWKLFQRLPGPRSAPNFAPRSLRGPGPAPPEPTEEALAIEAGLRLLMQRVAPTSLVVTDRLDLVGVFGNGGDLLSVPIGRASPSILPMLPPGLRTIVSMASQRALQSGEECHLASADRSVRALPLTLGASGRRFVVLVFEEQGRAVAPVQVSDDGQAQVAELQRELAFVRDSLQTTIEELETSNEELQATNEELLASNEELQATNEELQAVNEELKTVNAESQSRIAELVQTHQDMDNLLQSTPVPTLFLDEQLLVRRFTPSVSKIFPLLSRDLGRPLDHLSTRLLDPTFWTHLAEVLQTGAPYEQPIGTADGDELLVRVAPYLTRANQVRGLVLTFVDVTRLRRSEDRGQSLQRLIDSLPEAIAVVDPAGVIRFVNQQWWRFAETNGLPGRHPSVDIGASYLDACRSEPEVDRLLRELLAGQRTAFEWEYPCHAPDERRWFVVHAAGLGAEGAVLSHVDITARRLAGERP